jgi:hypothetical protein
MVGLAQIMEHHSVAYAQLDILASAAKSKVNIMSKT